MPNSELLTAADVAVLARVHTETVRRWTRSGQLPAVTLPSGRRRYYRTDVLALLELHAAAPSNIEVPAARSGQVAL